MSLALGRFKYFWYLRNFIFKYSKSWRQCVAENSRSIIGISYTSKLHNVQRVMCSCRAYWQHVNISN